MICECCSVAMSALSMGQVWADSCLSTVYRENQSTLLESWALLGVRSSFPESWIRGDWTGIVQAAITGGGKEEEGA